MVTKPAKDFTSTVELFLDSRKTAQTKRLYTKGLEVTTNGDPAGFLSRVRKDKDAEEERLIKWIQNNKKVKKPLKSGTISGYLAALKSLCDFSETLINWKKIKSTIPESQAGSDRAPYLSEIRSLYETLKLKERFVVSFFVSTGARRGSVEFTLPNGQMEYLRMRDIEELPELGIAAVRIYRGCPEEYFTFLTSEALEDFHNYLEYRKRFGEIITPDSPVFRRAFNWDHSKDEADSEYREKQVIPASLDSIAAIIQRGWEIIGLKQRNFPQQHGFRMYFKTVLEDNSSLKTSQIERLMGHGAKKVANRYYKPEVLKLGTRFAQNQQALFIQEGRIAKIKIAELEEEKSKFVSMLMKMDTRLKEQDERLAKLEGTGN